MLGWTWLIDSFYVRFLCMTRCFMRDLLALDYIHTFEILYSEEDWGRLSKETRCASIVQYMYFHMLFKILFREGV